MKNFYSAFRLGNFLFGLSCLLMSHYLTAAPEHATTLAPRAPLFAPPAFVLAGSNPFTMTMSFPNRLITGDFDSDGDTDILYQNGSTQGTGFGYVRNKDGGSYNFSSLIHPILVDCAFVNNIATRGGAIFNVFSRPSLTNCPLRSNMAAEGHAVFNYGECGQLINCAPCVS